MLRPQRNPATCHFSAMFGPEYKSHPRRAKFTFFGQKCSNLLVSYLRAYLTCLCGCAPERQQTILDSFPVEITASNPSQYWRIAFEALLKPTSNWLQSTVPVLGIVFEALLKPTLNWLQTRSQHSESCLKPCWSWPQTGSNAVPVLGSRKMPPSLPHLRTLFEAWSKVTKIPSGPRIWMRFFARKTCV